MKLLKLLLGFAGKVPIRYWEYLGLALFLSAGILWYNHHEREIGRQALEAKIAEAQQQTQAKLDALSSEQNKKLQDKYDSINFTPVTPIDLKLPADCGPVSDDIRMRVNAAHKTSGR